MTNPPPVKKACDACHRRKVRCSGGQPCKNCGQASLQCTYLAIPQKKGPKGSRAKVISEIRDIQQQKTSPQKAASSTSEIIHDAEPNPFDFNTSPMSPPIHTRNLDLLSAQIVDNCISFFFDHLYPTMPIFSRQHLNTLAIEYRSGSSETYCLVLALCSFIMIQPGMVIEGMPLPEMYDLDPSAARYRLAASILREIHAIRKNIDYVDNPTVHSVRISFFLFCSYFGLDKTSTCWYHLREASTLAHMLNMNEEATYKSGNTIDNMYNRRFYWLVLITERANALQRHKPLSMLATIDLPTVNPTATEAPVMHGFVYLASLFRLIDDEFMALWNKAKSECTTSYLSQLQSQLADVIPPVLECTENQAADVKVTQHWLRCMVWQLSMTNGYLSSNASDLAMSFKYPIEITRALIQDINNLSLQSMEVHGVGLIEKFFDIAWTLSDVVTFVPLDEYSESPYEYLNQLLNLISRLRGGASRYVPLLMAKVAESLPNMSNPPSLMPRSLDDFTTESTSSSPTEIKHPQPVRRIVIPQTLPSQTHSTLPTQSQIQGTQLQPQSQMNQLQSPHTQMPQNPSPAPTGSALGQQSPFPGNNPSLYFGEQSPSVHTPQQGLMFETYTSSPSTGEGVTPPIYGQTFPQSQPRSIPSTGIDGWNGFQ